MAKFIYEHRPHLYGILGLAAILGTKQSVLFLGSGLLFMAAGVSLRNMRMNYRRRYAAAVQNGPTTAYRPYMLS